jgi:hypothetical protein
MDNFAGTEYLFAGIRTGYNMAAIIIFMLQ